VAGNTEKALRLLRRSIRYNSNNKKTILHSNKFDRLRLDPRFKELVGEP